MLLLCPHWERFPSRQGQAIWLARAQSNWIRTRMIWQMRMSIQDHVICFLTRCKIGRGKKGEGTWRGKLWRERRNWDAYLSVFVVTSYFICFYLINFTPINFFSHFLSLPHSLNPNFFFNIPISYLLFYLNKVRSYFWPYWFDLKIFNAWMKVWSKEVAWF